MKTRSFFIPALIVVLGAWVFVAGMWVGQRRVLGRVPRTASVQSELSIPQSQPQKPTSAVTPPATPTPETPRPASRSVSKPARPLPYKVAVARKPAVDSREYARGKVIDPSGKALAGAEITIGGAWVTHAVTGTDGEFRIEVPQLEWKPGG